MAWDELTSHWLPIRSHVYVRSPRTSRLRGVTLKRLARNQVPAGLLSGPWDTCVEQQGVSCTWPLTRLHVKSQSGLFAHIGN